MGDRKWTKHYGYNWEWCIEFTRPKTTEVSWVKIQANRGGVYVDQRGLMMPPKVALEIIEQIKVAVKIAEGDDPAAHDPIWAQADAAYDRLTGTDEAV